MEWVICPSCQLKHSARPDGVCPRCGASIQGGGSYAAAVAASPYAPPQATIDGATAREVAPQEATPSTINPLHVTGIILLINAVLGLIEMGVMLSAREKGGFNSPVPLIIDAVVGVGLLQNKPDYRRWAIIRSVLGLVVYSGILIAKNDPFSAVINAVYIAGLLMLLIGQPGKGRIWAGIGLAAVCMLLEMLGLMMMATGKVG
jgi:hypothetical protein